MECVARPGKREGGGCAQEAISDDDCDESQDGTTEQEDSEDMERKRPARRQRKRRSGAPGKKGPSVSVVCASAQGWRVSLRRLKSRSA